MPQSIREILRIIDNPKILQKLIAELGGTEVRVPFKNIPQNCRLKEILGLRAMQRFMESFGGTEIYIPLCNDFLCRLRNAEIIQKYKSLIIKGNSKRNSIDCLALEYKLSTRHIRNLLKINPWEIKPKK